MVEGSNRENEPMMVRHQCGHVDIRPGGTKNEFITDEDRRFIQRWTGEFKKVLPPRWSRVNFDFLKLTDEDIESLKQVPPPTGEQFPSFIQRLSSSAGIVWLWYALAMWMDKRYKFQQDYKRLGRADWKHIRVSDGKTLFVFTRGEEVLLRPSCGDYLQKTVLYWFWFDMINRSWSIKHPTLGMKQFPTVYDGIDWIKEINGFTKSEWFGVKIETVKTIKQMRSKLGFNCPLIPERDD